MPSAARSSDRNKTLRSTQRGAEPRCKGLPSMLTRPLAPGTRPASARVTTLAPEPICPAMQRILRRGQRQILYDAADIEGLDHERLAGIRARSGERIHVAERPAEHQLDQLITRDVA